MKNKKAKIKCCPDCGVKPGQYHLEQCDVECCPGCGNQLLCCGVQCTKDPTIAWNYRKPWDGNYPGIAAAIRFGWYSKRVEGMEGWQPCAKDDPDASPDLNRIGEFTIWNVPKQDWELLRIIAAAIKYPGGLAIGKTHDAIYMRLIKRKPELVSALKSNMNGFFTNASKFVDRRTAQKIAFNAGQIASSKEGPLISEEIINDPYYIGIKKDL